MENPINDPTEELNPHKLCMSEANGGFVMLFCATRASSVTSAIAAPVLCAVSATIAATMPKLLCRESIRMDDTPIIPTLLLPQQPEVSVTY